MRATDLWKVLTHLPNAKQALGTGFLLRAVRNPGDCKIKQKSVARHLHILAPFGLFQCPPSPTLFSRTCQSALNQWLEVGVGGKDIIIVHAKLHSRVACEVFYGFVKGRGGTWGIMSFTVFFSWLSGKKGA